MVNSAYPGVTLKTLTSYTNSKSNNSSSGSSSTKRKSTNCSQM